MSKVPCTHDQASVEFCIRITLSQKIRFAAQNFTQEELCERLRVEPEQLEEFLFEFTSMEHRPDIVSMMRVADALDVHMTFRAETTEEINSNLRHLRV